MSIPVIISCTSKHTHGKSMKNLESINLLPPRHINNGHNDTKIGTRTHEG